MIAMGIFFYRFASAQQGISSEAEYGFHVASIVLFSTGPFLLLIYWLVLPTKINIRLSPDNRDQFLDRANRALSDWNRTHSF